MIYGHCQLTCVIDGQLHARLLIYPQHRDDVVGNTAVACFSERRFESLMITRGTGLFSPILALDEEIVIADCRKLPSIHFNESELRRMVEECEARRVLGYLPPVHSEEYFDAP